MRGTLATSSQRYWKKFKCRQRLSMVSCTPDKALQRGHSKCSPGVCSSRSSKRFGSPSKRHWATRHCRPSPRAAVKSSSGVMLANDSNPHPKRKSPFSSPRPGPFAADSPWRGTSQELSNAKGSYPPERAAKPAQGRNEINGRGPPPAGRMPFMSDSTLNRRSAALQRPNCLTKLPTENSEEPSKGGPSLAQKLARE